jgi:hypothetical protein
LGELTHVEQASIVQWALSKFTFSRVAVGWRPAATDAVELSSPVPARIRSEANATPLPV